MPRYYCWMHIVTTDTNHIFYELFSHDNIEKESTSWQFPEGQYADAVTCFNQECDRLAKKWYGE